MECVCVCECVRACVRAWLCACVGGEREGKKKHMCAHLRAYVCRTCLSALFEYVAFRNYVTVKESSVGSEYASAYERMCSSVMLVYVTAFGKQAKTTRNVFTFDKNEF